MSKIKKKAVVAAALTILVLAAVFLGISYFTGAQMVAGSTQLVTNEQTKAVHEGFWLETEFDYDAFSKTYKIEPVHLTSSLDGHTIPVDFIYSEQKHNNVVIMIHGLGGNRFTNYPMAAFFLENGYNVITYDQRSSGENIAENTTFGYWEKYDSIDCINFVKEFAKGKNIGVWGESFGGATAIQAVAFEHVQNDVAFLALDCPVSSMEWMIAEETKTMETGLPLGYLMWCGNLVNQVKLGFSYLDVDGAEAAKRIHIPTLVINSEADKLTPYFMGKDIYDSLASTEKELWTVKDSAHVGIWEDYVGEYSNKLIDLIKND